jgi:uncharacterized delta-60 repeat protein
MKKKKILPFVLFLVLSFSRGQNISIDATYGTNGYVSGATNGRFTNLAALLPDNKILVAGNANANTSYVVEKRVEDGTSDPTFGTNGFMLVNIVAGSKDNANAMQVQSDGTILVAGTSDSDLSLFGTYWDVFVSRLLPDGTLDMSFGTNGHVKTNLGTNDDQAWEIATTSTGAIYVLAATQNTSIATKLLKYDATGNLDITFGTNGVLDVPTAIDSRVYEMQINAQDEILISGTELNSATNEYEVRVLKLDTQGAFITSFGNSGIVSITDPLENYTTSDMITTSDGGLFIIGAAGSSSSNTKFAMYKLTSNGVLDATFNSTGYAYFDHSSSNYGVTFGYSVAQLPDGSYIAQADIIGNNNYDLLLLNIGANGLLVNSFGNGGRFIVARSTYQDYSRQVLVQDDGKVVVVGLATDSTTRRTMLVRFKDAYTLSSSSENETPIAIFPNPFNDQIKVNSKAAVSQMTLFNALGQQITEAYSQNIMNTSNLPSGVYFLQIEDELGATSTHQLIKEW